MDKKKIKILISIGIVLAAVGVAYSLDFSKWKEIDSYDSQILQVKTDTQAKKSYYSSIDSKLQALNDAGWATKKDSIAINFDSSLWFTPKINNFFKAIVPTSGMTLVSMTSSLPESTREQAQTSTINTENGAEVSKTEEVPIQAVTQSTASYLNQLKGDVKRTTVSLNVAGTYSAFKNLLSIFRSQTRIVTIKSVAVTSAGQLDGVKTRVVGNNLNFSIILDVYSY